MVFTDRLLTLTPGSLAEPRSFMLRSLITPEEMSKPSSFYLYSAILLSRLKSSKFIRESSPADDTIARANQQTRFALGFFQRNTYVSAVWDALFTRFARSGEFSQLTKHETTSSIVIHVRRGDYLNPKTKRYHGLSSNQYFETASQLLSDITGCSSYLVVSDDVIGARTQLESSRYFSRQKLQFVSGLNEIETLSLMSSARGVVASNSSFSWWGARLCWSLSNGVVSVPTPWLAQDGAVDNHLHPIDGRWIAVRRLIS